jgi:hypothetical protein
MLYAVSSRNVTGIVVLLSRRLRWDVHQVLPDFYAGEVDAVKFRV